MAERFVPMLGDLSSVVQNQKENKSKFHHFIDESLENRQFDLRLLIVGSLVFLDVCSIQALDELERLIPSVIDRDEMKGLPLGNLIGGSVAGTRSDEKWVRRRKEMAKLIGLGCCSRHVPMMIETMDKYFEEVPLNQEIDITKLFTRITFEIITKIFFGKDITENMDKMEYTCPYTGKQSMLKFQEYYPKCVHDQFATFMSPKSRIWSFLAFYNLIEPFKSNAKNLKTFHASLISYLTSSKDQDSVYHELYKSGNFTRNDCVLDACQMLFAGFDTSSRALSGIVCLLKRNPDKLVKLYQEINDHDLANVTDLPQDQFKSVYNECDYLNFVIKEGLRMDAPAIESITYHAVEDCELTGVKICKGDRLEINNQYPHYNPEQWHRPEEFLPERFDPSNELFYKPGTKESRHPKSYIPFTFGTRNCLGQTLAKLELKVLLCRFLTKFDFEIKDEIMQNDKCRFHILDGSHLYGRITNKK